MWKKSIILSELTKFFEDDVRAKDMCCNVVRCNKRGFHYCQMQSAKSGGYKMILLKTFQLGTG